MDGGYRKLEPHLNEFDDLQRELVRVVVEDGGRVEFNRLSFVGKQAALNLARRRSVQIIEEGDSLVVERRVPNAMVRALTAGLYD